MFVRLQYILFTSIFIIFLFFVISAVSFSSRLRSSFPSKTWKHRFWFVEGWSSILYFIVFLAISILWRPSSNNRKLGLSEDQLCVGRSDEDEIDGLLRSSGHGEEEADELKDSIPLTSRGRRRSNSTIHESDREIVFEVGSEDGDEPPQDTKRKYRDESGGVGGEETERLRYSEGDDRQLDITTQHEDLSPTSFDAPPPEYRRSTKND